MKTLALGIIIKKSKSLNISEAIQVRYLVVINTWLVSEDGIKVKALLDFSRVIMCNEYRLYKQQNCSVYTHPSKSTQHPTEKDWKSILNKIYTVK